MSTEHCASYFIVALVGARLRRRMDEAMQSTSRGISVPRMIPSANTALSNESMHVRDGRLTVDGNWIPVDTITCVSRMET